jgi:hypothetical protein
MRLTIRVAAKHFQCDPTMGSNSRAVALFRLTPRQQRNESLVVPVFQLVDTDLSVTFRLHETNAPKASRYTPQQKFVTSVVASNALALQSNVTRILPAPIVHFLRLSNPAKHPDGDSLNDSPWQASDVALLSGRNSSPALRFEWCQYCCCSQ